MDPSSTRGNGRRPWTAARLTPSGFSPMVNVTHGGMFADGAALEGVRYGGPRPDPDRRDYPAPIRGGSSGSCRAPACSSAAFVRSTICALDLLLGTIP